eukprot:TRINITY_DN53209_c0_g1_i1.p1 TRINITY_DN53209_c0_g1~~TRINITY_DN53209_c0_g1_i1.p1  ORF type:complete len:257 (+),score=33.77 TRINITY_DN53209_c0_g1_i1:60-830(+)
MQLGCAMIVRCLSSTIQCSHPEVRLRKACLQASARHAYLWVTNESYRRYVTAMGAHEVRIPVKSLLVPGGRRCKAQGVDLGPRAAVLSRQKALESLRELDELLEDDLIEEAVHSIQLQGILQAAGVASREDLLETDFEKPQEAPTEIQRSAEEDPRVAHQEALDLLSELDELLDDELITEDVHSLQQTFILKKAGVATREELAPGTHLLRTGVRGRGSSSWHLQGYARSRPRTERGQKHSMRIRARLGAHGQASLP